MKNNLRKKLFQQYQDWLVRAGIETTNQDMVLCPLCWKEKQYKELSLEHIIPQSVGGNRCILTCTRCNNEHGSIFDSHISQFQSIEDAFNGYGTIPTTLRVKEKEVITNFHWKSKNIKIVGKASNPATVSGIQKMFKNNEVNEINLGMQFGFKNNSLQKGLLRCAYLALFNCFGYEYSKQRAVQIIHQQIYGQSADTFSLDSLTGVLGNAKLTWDNSHIIVPLKIDNCETYFVIVPLRKKTTTYRFVFMPKKDNFNEFLKMTVDFKKNNENNKINISFKNAFV